VGISAYQIEEFVRATLSSDRFETSDPTNAATEEFATAWRRLDERQQLATLSDVLKSVRFDPTGGTISMTLEKDALDRIRSR